MATTRIAFTLAGLVGRLRAQSGQGLVEYGLILVLVAVAVISALLTIGGQLNTVFGNVVTGLQGINP